MKVKSRGGLGVRSGLVFSVEGLGDVRWMCLISLVTAGDAAFTDRNDEEDRLTSVEPVGVKARPVRL